MRTITTISPHTTLKRLIVRIKDKMDSKDGIATIDYERCEGMFDC